MYVRSAASAGVGEAGVAAAFSTATVTAAAAGGRGDDGDTFTVNLKLPQQSGRKQEPIKKVLEARAALRADPRWHESLQLLDGLTELCICYKCSDRFLTLPVESLPASLEVMWCDRVSLVSATVGSSTVPSNSVATTSAGGWMPTHSACGIGLAKRPELQKLGLHECQLSSPSILASKTATELNAHGSEWPGGWAAAAAAWPNVRELTWAYDSTSSHSCSNHVHVDSSLKNQKAAIAILTQRPGLRAAISR